MVKQLYAWGANSHGQLAVGYQSEQCNVPTLVPTDHLPEEFCDQITAISGGGGHCLFLTKCGSMYSCGWNHRGQLGIGDSVKSVQKISLITSNADLGDIQHIRTGWDCSAAVMKNGTVFMWGSNSYEQLGMANHLPQTQIQYHSPIALRLPDDEPCLDMQFGLRNTVFLTENHMFVIGAEKMMLSLETKWPKLVERILHLGVKYWRMKRNIKHFAVGQSYVAFVDEADKVSETIIHTFGDSRYGQKVKRFIHDPPHTIRKIAAGWAHGGYLNETGVIHMWGRNNYGQLGVDPKHTGPMMRTPISLTIEPSDDRVIDFVLGAEHGLCITQSSAVWAWGWNEHGNCGNGSDKNVHTPIRVDIPGTCSLIGAGSGFNFVVTSVDPKPE